MRKKLFGIILFAFFVLIGCNDNVDPVEVPSEVSQTLTTRYPGATDIEWEKEEESGAIYYKAEFKFGSNEMKAKFDANGSFISEEAD